MLPVRTKIIYGIGLAFAVISIIGIGYIYYLDWPGEGIYQQFFLVNGLLGAAVALLLIAGLIIRKEKLLNIASGALQFWLYFFLGGWVVLWLTTNQ